MPKANDTIDTVRQIEQFAQTLNGKDPKALVMQILEQRGITPEGFNDLIERAQNISSMFHF